MKVYIGSDEMKGLGFHVATGDIKDAATTPDKVLAPNVFYGNDGRQIGTMPNRGGMSAELAAGGGVSIPEGYHNGEGVVRAQDLASQTAGTMTAETLSVGETGWVNGKQITGSLVVPEANDWDPYEMEENVMLDLTGYTLVKYISTPGSGVNSFGVKLSADKTYILVNLGATALVVHDGSESGNVVACVAENEAIKFAGISTSGNLGGTVRSALWVKN